MVKKEKVMKKYLKQTKSFFKIGKKHSLISVLAVIIGVIYLLLNIWFEKTNESVVFVIVFLALYGLIQKLELSLMVAILLSIIIPLLYTKLTVEGFQTNMSQKKETQNVSEKDLPSSDKKEENEEKVEKTTNDVWDDDDDDEVKDNHIDVGTSFMEACKSLKPDQIEKMTKDTKDLMETQKSLIKTMETLAPVVQDGHKILENFKNIFPKGMKFDKMGGGMSNSLEALLQSTKK